MEDLGNTATEVLLSDSSSTIRVYGISKKLELPPDTSGKEYRLGTLEQGDAAGLGIEVNLQHKDVGYGCSAVIKLPDYLLEDRDATFNNLVQVMDGKSKIIGTRDDGFTLKTGLEEREYFQVAVLSKDENSDVFLNIYNQILSPADLEPQTITKSDSFTYSNYYVGDAVKEMGKTVADIADSLSLIMEEPDSEQEDMLNWEDAELCIDIPDGPPSPKSTELATVNPTPEQQATINPSPEENQPEYIMAQAEFPTFDDFGGLEKEIASLMQAAAEANAPAELLEKYGLKRSGGILLEGEPGVGKTELVRALAKEMGAELQEISVSDIVGRYTGTSELALRGKFNAASKEDHTVILFFDEMDGMFSQEAGGNEGAAISLISEFKTLLTNRHKYPNVLVIGAANSLDNFDPALLRPDRFDKNIKIGKPNPEGRYAIFDKYLQKASAHFELKNLDTEIEEFQTGETSETAPGTVNINELVAMTEDWTGADIKEAVHGMLRRKMLIEIQAGAEPPTLTHQGLLQAIKNQRQNRPTGS